MEWQGINLTNYHQEQWLKAIKLRFIQYLIVTLFFILDATILYWSSNSVYSQYVGYQTKNSQINKEISNQKMRLARIKLRQQRKIEAINSQNIEKFLNEIKQIPINGIINEINIKHNITDYFLLSGQLDNQQSFEMVTQYLSHLKNITFSVDMLQTNSDYQLDFVIKISRVK
ncbi:hypothetical protein [Phocoenobacter skyensis]|uniref:Fimbrial assembly protein (PilN) n=1 Tax=Phocoenobacter skyensis TaxID=97481 RepID=A0A1H7UWP7_9PAST|nr:hypothetical protein [Pasteurella skyensis]MDP8078554.1 hypothetical protein [Pasteurella skyensis]MDP8084354.1 hypothetical protein [Pasteurella skyensis]MDP8171332.1 hypothetical protein [Pasteurella skyensis]MDP8175551.1 hypothetical protein [Pasteurella skyensis]MDP8184685.1 hypothetical protein [Pasteurella skyensis]